MIRPELEKDPIGHSLWWSLNRYRLDEGEKMRTIKSGKSYQVYEYRSLPGRKFKVTIEEIK